MTMTMMMMMAITMMAMGPGAEERFNHFIYLFMNLSGH